MTKCVLSSSLSQRWTITKSRLRPWYAGLCGTLIFQPIIHDVLQVRGVRGIICRWCGCGCRLWWERRLGQMVFVISTRVHTRCKTSAGAGRGAADKQLVSVGARVWRWTWSSLSHSEFKQTAAVFRNFESGAAVPFGTACGQIKQLNSNGCNLTSSVYFFRYQECLLYRSVVVRHPSNDVCSTSYNKGV